MIRCLVEECKHNDGGFCDESNYFSPTIHHPVRQGWNMKDKRIPCKSMFSNGLEYLHFLETQCLNGCTRFRKGQCRIYHRIEDARWIGESVFPFDDLLDWEHYAGKACKSYTTKPPLRKKPRHKVDKNQIEMEI